MRIAVTSQNLEQVTGHAGRCRSFIVFEPAGGEPGTPQPIRLAADQVFHDWDGASDHPLAGINVLITGGIGAGLADRLHQRGIQAVVTQETDPERAVRRLIAGNLAVIRPGCTDDHAAAPSNPGHGHSPAGGGCSCRCGH